MGNKNAPKREKKKPKKVQPVISQAAPRVIRVPTDKKP